MRRSYSSVECKCRLRVIILCGSVCVQLKNVGMNRANYHYLLGGLVRLGFIFRCFVTIATASAWHINLVQPTAAFRHSGETNRMWPIEWHQHQWPLVALKVALAVWSHLRQYNYYLQYVYTYSESARGLRCQLSYRNWRTFQGHRQSRALALCMGNYLGNGAR